MIKSSCLSTTRIPDMLLLYNLWAHRGSGEADIMERLGGMNWGNFSTFYKIINSRFKDLSLCVQHTVDVIVSEINNDIPHTLLNLHAKQSCYNHMAMLSF